MCRSQRKNFFLIDKQNDHKLKLLKSLGINKLFSVLSWQPWLFWLECLQEQPNFKWNWFGISFSKLVHNQKVVVHCSYTFKQNLSSKHKRNNFFFLYALLLVAKSSSWDNVVIPLQLFLYSCQIRWQESIPTSYLWCWWGRRGWRSGCCCSWQTLSFRGCGEGG